MPDLETDVRYIKGIGEARAKALAKLGISTLRDLVMNFPRTYEDRTQLKRIDELIAGDECCVMASVTGTPVLQHISKGRDMVRVRVSDGTGSMNITYFNQSYVRDRLIPGKTYVFYGRVGGRIGLPEMVNPVFEEETGRGATRTIVPVYRLTAGISQNMMSRAVAAGLAACGDLMPDSLPEDVRKKYSLSIARYAYEKIHFPGSAEDIEIARKRLIFEEFFVLSCALMTLREKRVANTGHPMKWDDMDEFFDALPFTPTGAQMRCINEALDDMERSVPMSRLIQGDVGSGKTMVAAACCYYAVMAGYQCAVMAPTEILAEQHANTLAAMLAPHDITVALLTGGMKAAQRRNLLTRLKSGEIDLVVGTHALISESVEYKNLGLVVADEQHRFGVEQRAALSRKGDAPHVLVMSATPIPRTLALIVYGDLDVSIIDELPPGRQKVDTFAVGEDMRQRIYAFIRKQVGEGRQVFIVCPEVEENEEAANDLKSVKEYAKELSESVFPDLKVALVHGKMKSADKEKTMAAFAAGEADILVATTVIEVGVDVPNATLMVVENADRFGLSQLHQLRGRVGRGKHKSYCILFNGSAGETAAQRLKAMCDTNDGFKIAEEDLRLRGPGDFFGNRQSGLPRMRIASFATDINLLRDAQSAAKDVLRADPELTERRNAGLKWSVDNIIEKNADGIN